MAFALDYFARSRLYLITLLSSEMTMPLISHQAFSMHDDLYEEVHALCVKAADQDNPSTVSVQMDFHGRISMDYSYQGHTV